MTVKSRSNRGWYHKLRWIHVKVDTKNEGKGSSEPVREQV